MTDSKKRRPGIALVAAVGSLGIAALQASRMIDHIRAVDIITLFASGMAAGAGLFAAITQYRAARPPAD